MQLQRSAQDTLTYHSVRRSHSEVPHAKTAVPAPRHELSPRPTRKAARTTHLTTEGPQTKQKRKRDSTSMARRVKNMKFESAFSSTAGNKTTIHIYHYIQSLYISIFSPFLSLVSYIFAHVAWHHRYSRLRCSWVPDSYSSVAAPAHQEPIPAVATTAAAAAQARHTTYPTDCRSNT